MPPAKPPFTPENPSLERMAHGLFLAGWDGHELSPEVDQLLHHGLRGVVLFAKNIRTADQTDSLCRAVHAARGPGGLIGIDQEGGRVARLRDGFFVAPPMAELGRSASPELVYDLGRLVGLQLKAMGIHLNFAPVLDVDTHPDNPVIGNRAFGRDPQRVAQLGAALARGLQDVGVAACGKHFPGHGDTHQDSHHTLPRLSHTLERLRQVELPPFQHAIDQGIASLMTAHIVFESFNASPQDNTPATLSPEVVTGLLRQTMGFDGVVISDDLEMKAIADHRSIEEVAVQALRAGVDLLIACHDPGLIVRAAAAVVKAVRSGQLSEGVVRAAHARVETLAQRYRPTPRNHALIDREAQERATLESRLAAAFADLQAASASADPTDYMHPTSDHG